MVSVYSEKDKKRRSAPQRAQGGQRHAGQKAEGVESHHRPFPRPRAKGLIGAGIPACGRLTSK